MKKIFTLTFIFIGIVFAYNSEKSMGVAFDVGGPNTIVQTEIDLRLVDTGVHYIGISGGMGMFINAFAIPLGLQYRYGKKHQLETVAYLTLLSTTDGAKPTYSLKVGYRLNFSKAFFHIYISPLINQQFSVQPWGGLGLGIYL